MVTQNWGKLMRIYLDEGDRWEHQPLYAAIVERLRAAGFEGATVFKGIEGYGRHAIVRTLRIPDAISDLPVVIEVVEKEERIAAFMPVLEQMLRGAMVTLENVNVLHYKISGGAADE